jgi:hypothetical protein
MMLHKKTKNSKSFKKGWSKSRPTKSSGMKKISESGRSLIWRRKKMR